MARTSIRERPDREEVLWPVQKACPATPDANPCIGDASGNTVVLKFVSVTATQAFSPLLAYAQFVFPANLTRTTTLRLQ